jgi:DNA-binding GntR family transcriptional regulator
MRAAAGDASAAGLADEDFHARLTANCPWRPLHEMLRHAKRALLRYEEVYMVEPARIERSAAQHDEIVRVLERGDHAEAARLLRRNLTGGLPDLADVLEAR